jgi:RND family efflux transporter MFP subunit
VKKKILLGASLALLLGVVALRVAAVAQAARPAAPPPRPEPVPAALPAAPDDERVVLTGSIRARNAVEIHPEMSGRIEKIHAKVGDVVHAGQLLATLEHDELAWGEKAARAAVDLARANLAGARLEHARTKELHAGGAAASAQLDQAGVRLALAEAQLAQAEAAAGLAAEGVRNARLVSPIAGVVTRRPVDVGAQVGPATVAFAVEDLSSLRLESAIDAASWPRFAVGTPVEVTADARPGETFRGAVTLRARSLDPVTRRAPVEIEIAGAEGKLLPGMFARAAVAR